MEITRKVLPCTIVEKSAGKPLVALVSTPNADLVGDIIFPMPSDKGRGWLVDDFNKRGGRINWMHDTWSRPNLAKSKATPTAEGLILEVAFDMKDSFAAELDRKYREGFLDEWSIQAKYLVAEGNEFGGLSSFETQLWEVSAVNAGMNQYTETISKSLGEMQQRIAALEAVALAQPESDDAKVKALLEEIAKVRAGLVPVQRT